MQINEVAYKWAGPVDPSDGHPPHYPASRRGGDMYATAGPPVAPGQRVDGDRLSLFRPQGRARSTAAVRRTP